MGIFKRQRVGFRTLTAVPVGFVALVAVLVLGLSPAHARTIKWGFVGGLSGFCGATVQAAKLGMEMAVKEINASGGINGNQVEIIYRDSKSKPDEGAKQARDLLENAKVDILTGPCSSSVWRAIAPLALEHKVPIYSFAAKSHRATIDFGHPYIWSAHANTLMDANATAEYTAKKGWKKIVTIGLDYEWGRQFVGMYVQRLKQLDPNVVITKQLWPKFGESNMNSFITATLAEKPDGVLVATFGPTSTSLIKQGKSYGMFKRTNVLTIMPIEVLKALGPDMPEGIHGLAFAPFFGLGTKKGAEFVKKFRAIHNMYPTDFSVNGYDTMMHMAAGMRRAGSTDTEKVRRALASMTYDGLRGPLKFRYLDNQVSAPVYIGITKHSPEYKKFAILDNIAVIPGIKIWGDEAMVRKMRAAAKKSK